MTLSTVLVTWASGQVSVGAVVVGLFVYPQTDRRLGLADALDGADAVVDDAEQVLVVAADDLQLEVVPAGGEHAVVDLVDLADRLGGETRVTGHRDRHRGHHPETEGDRVGYGDDLQGSRVDQRLHPLPDGGLGQADRVTDRGVGAAAVLLELAQDRLAHVVEQVRRRTGRAGAVAGAGHGSSWGSVPGRPTAADPSS